MRNYKMINLHPHRILFNLFLGASLIILVQAANATAQSLLSGSTSAGAAPGSPAGSYALSGFETVNPYSGNLNFSLPLLQLSGRGGTGVPVKLTINHKWTVKSELDGYGNVYRYAEEYNWNEWFHDDKGYSPGQLVGRKAGALLSHCPNGGDGWTTYARTLTRLTFTAPDGTEYELRDQDTGGKPFEVGYCNPGNNQSRGTVFVTADGSSAMFTSDTVIYDDMWPGGNELFLPSGYLTTSNGTRYRIVDGKIVWLRDRNGNKVVFTYYSGYDMAKIAKITDSLNREVIFEYGVQDIAPYGLCDRITYKGFDGATRVIRISYKSIEGVLRSGYQKQTHLQLFPEIYPATPVGPVAEFALAQYNPTKVSAVWLPDGRSYQLRYNSHGELARVELPTGSAIEYDWSNARSSGSGKIASVDYEGIYRRIVQRRVSYGNVLESRLLVGAPECLTNRMGYVIQQLLDANGTLLNKTKHYYYGILNPNEPPPGSYAGLFYDPWQNGREYQTEAYDGSGTTVLQRTTQLWTQASPNWHTESSADAPANNPHVTETTTTLADTNQVSKQTYSYDVYSNLTDTYEYDYGVGIAGALLRRTHTDYLTTNPINNQNYTLTNIHILGLPSQQWVSSDAEGDNKQSLTVYEYDNYATDSLHAPLEDRLNISGFDPAFNTTYSSRGNVTMATTYTDAQNITGPVTVASQYDIAGNVVKAIDARGYTTTFDYSDSFGTPDAEARNTISPPELNALQPVRKTYAFASLITNAAGHKVYTQFDYYLGRPVNVEDSNGTVLSSTYDDPLDRPTQIIKAANFPTLKSQTTINYDDAHRTVTSTSDQVSFNDNQLKSQSLYDGLGRTIETRAYETSSSYIISRQEFDGLGRIKRTYNPYRTIQDATYGWVDTTYDALSRAKRIETFNASSVSTGAVVTTYSGNHVTVTDQSGKQRKSETDALGRLIEMVEAPNAGSFNFETSYLYDALGNLRRVTQGQQNRYFMYDSLSRLIRAKNPEQQANAALNLTDALTNNSSWSMAYTYDANGNIKTRTEARGGVAIYTYDNLNRLSFLNYSDTTPDVTYTYDTLTNGKGRLTSISSSASTYSYAGYDELGRVTGSSQITAGQPAYTMPNYQYDLAGNLLSQTYPSGHVVTNEYDRAGRLSGTKQGSGSYYAGAAPTDAANRLQYTAHGAVAAMKLGNGLWEHTVFNSRLQPTQIGLGTLSTNSTVLQLGYAYGTTTNNGNVQSQTITIPGLNTLTQTYNYDSLNRLRSASEAGGANPWTQAFIYDDTSNGGQGGRYGNRRIDTLQTTANMQPAAGSNPTFDLTINRMAANQGYGYDMAGNLTSQPGYSFSYDGENRLSSSTDTNAKTTNYSYDGDGRRVKKTTLMGTTVIEETVFVYNASGQMVAEYNTDSPPSTSGTSYLTSDALGTPRVITKADGSVEVRHDYLPFGEELFAGTGGRSTGQGYGGNDGVKQKFAGKIRDEETGLDFSEARYYAPAQGRFTSIDPILITEDRLIDPQQINLYHYARNNPLRFTDPTGEDIDDSSLRDNQDYQSWKTAFLKTKAGQDFWNKYSRSEYKVTISMGENAGGEGGAETIPMFDTNGKLVGGTIILGTEFAKKEASGEYPIGSTLTPDVTGPGGYPQKAVSREARAVAFLAHEFGHLEDAERRGQVAWQRDRDFIIRNQEGFNALGQQWVRTPGYRQLLNECGCSNPSELATRREVRADGYTRGVLREYYGKGAGHGEMPKRVRQAIQAYEKGRPR